MKKRMAIAFDSSKPCELRVFACLELFCFPISVLTLTIVPFLIVNHFFGEYQISSGLNIVIKIMLAAATGYITNYIAVEMLFKPYYKSKRHALSILTFGYWSQWLESDEGVCKVQDFVKLAREKMSDYVLLWVKENFRKIVRGAIRSEGIWEYVRCKLMPAVKEPLEIWLRGSGKDLVLAKLNLSERISSAVNLLSVEQFHERVNTIAAQHLGAIQVLGYFLGAIVGVGLLAVG